MNDDEDDIEEFEIEDGVLTGYSREVDYEEVTVPSGVTEIDDNAFFECDWIQKVILPAGVTRIGDCAFCKCDSLENIEIPEGITSIGEQAFWGCKSLSSISIPASVTTIGVGAFANCYYLDSVKLSKGLKKIGSYAFDNCQNLSEIEIPEGVVTIGVEAFKKCYSLKTITIPEGVTEIGDGAFSECEDLDTVELPSTLSEVNPDIFDDSYEGTVIIDLSKYNPSQFEGNCNTIVFFLVDNSPSLLKDDFEEEKLNSWIDYFRDNGDLFYDEIIENDEFFQFLLKYKCLILEDVIALIGMASNEGLTELSVRLLEYEHNNFTEEDIAKFMEA